MSIEEKYEKAMFIIEKIAQWDPESHCMTKAESFMSCKKMAQTLINYVETEGKDNIVFLDQYLK